MEARRPRVLVVDDEPRNLNLLEALLAPIDVDVTRAAGGREGIETFTRLARENEVDMVLLDVMMPDVDGFTALSAMRAATAVGERIPIVLVTALQAREDRLRGLQAGADDFLSKPLDPNETRCRVRTFLALRKAQRDLRDRAAELEKAQRARAELARMLVHDLKNPLGAIGSNLGWIARRLVRLGVNDHDLQEAFEDCQGAARRLLMLIGGLIDVEKAETGQLQVKARPSQVDAMLGAIERVHRKEMEPKSIEFEVEADASVVAVDPDLLGRVMENLVENAIRYTPHQGKISLEGRVIDGDLRISVSNTGKVIPEDLRARIFEKHVSTEDLSSRGRSQGLGLYFCRLAVRAHGGEIEVSSTPEWPTRFTLIVPGAVRASQAPTPRLTGGSHVESHPAH